jgi:hypothetical protein
MKRFALLAGLACLFISPGRAATVDAGGKALQHLETQLHSALNRTVRVTERGYTYPVYRPDMAALDRLLAPGFLLVTASGKRITRPQWLECVRVGNLFCSEPPPAPLPNTSDRLVEETLKKDPDAERVSAIDITYESADTDVRTFGNTAVVFSSDNVSGGDVTFFLKKPEGIGGAFSSPDLRATRVYAKLNGRWKLALFQLTAPAGEGGPSANSP